MELTIAVVSDLHCHHSSAVPAETMLLTDAPRSPASHHPVEALRELLRTNSITADVMVMPGDITNRMDNQGIISGWDYVGQIAIALRARLLAATLGNHDVQSRNPKKGDPFSAARLLVPSFPLSEDGPLNEFWANGFCIVDSDNVRIVIINSVASHTTKDAAEHGLITSDQLARLKSALAGGPKKTFQIAVCHHHPMLHEDIGLGTNDVMENGSLLTELLAANGFHLVIHGHKHHPKLSYAPGATPLPVLAAGSFAAGMKNGLASITRNLFHVITLRLSESPGLLVKGIIKTWQFRLSKGWVPASWASADFPFETGFGCYDPPATIAAKIVAAVQDNPTELLQWAAISAKVPELPYVIPSTFEQVGVELDPFGIRMYPTPPDKPDIVGAVST